MTDRSLYYLSLAQASRLLGSRRLSPVELTRAVLERIAEVQPSLNAFTVVLAEQALAEARRAEQAIARGRRIGPLHGVPVSVKDIYDMRGLQTSCGSRVMHDHVAEEDATAVRLLREAGAIIVGKTNMTEFAVDVVSPVHGPAHNPWATEYSAGLSSSGSGAAVTAGASFASLGTDTGGSIRMPAAFCGCVGIKPTYGRVSRHGIFPLCWSLDHAGPLARTVQDAALVLRAIAGHDPRDPSSSQARVPAYRRALGGNLHGLRVGIPKEHFFDNVDTEIAAAVERAAAVLRSLGASVRTVSIPHATKAPQAVGGFIRVEQVAAHEALIKTRLHLYSQSLGDRLVAASVRPAALYINALRVRAVLIEEFRQALEQADVLITPTTPILPYKISEQPQGGAGQGARISVNTSPANMTGLPAISLPCGFSKGGLPIGLQIMGRGWEEGTVLRAAHAYERATEWHTRRPPASPSSGGEPAPRR